MSAYRLFPAPTLVPNIRVPESHPEASRGQKLGRTSSVQADFLHIMASNEVEPRQTNTHPAYSFMGGRLIWPESLRAAGWLLSEDEELS